MANVTFDFSGTTTIVTGGASGIGLAAAETIVSSGGEMVPIARIAKAPSAGSI